MRTLTAGRRHHVPLGWAVAGLVSLVVLTGCDTNGTTSETPDVAGVGGQVGSIVLGDVFIDSGTAVAAGASVPLRATFTNPAETTGRLVSVRTSAAGSVQLLDANGSPSAQGIPIPADGQFESVVGTARLRLVDVKARISLTQLVPVTFVFSGAGQVTLQVPVATSGSTQSGTSPGQARSQQSTTGTSAGVR